MWQWLSNSIRFRNFFLFLINKLIISLLYLCVKKKKKKGSEGVSPFVFLLNAIFSTVSQYKDKLERDCCLDGIRETPTSSNCEKRSEFIADTACFEAFLHCCKEIEKKRAERKEDGLKLARSKKHEQWMEGGYKWSYWSL